MSQAIDDGDFALFFSDSMRPLLNKKEFRVLINKKKLGDYLDKHLNDIDGSEGSLVVLKVH